MATTKTTENGPKPTPPPVSGSPAEREAFERAQTEIDALMDRAGPYASEEELPLAPADRRAIAWALVAGFVLGLVFVGVVSYIALP